MVTDVALGHVICMEHCNMLHVSGEPVSALPSLPLPAL